METGKPLISILMAVYEPRLDWLKEQLDSLNAQTYPNLRLCVRDDCSPTVSFGEIKALVAQCITAFPYTVERNGENLGSNKTFETLTAEAEGEYFAYCDQDDIWMPEKLTVLQEVLAGNPKAALVCSDVIPIDGAGNKLGESIRALRPRHVFQSGAGLAPSLLYRNFVIGCTMLIRSDLARRAIPFAESMVHDHYLAFVCALEHEIVSLEQPLICHRIHGGNQTGVLAHIRTKEDYVERHMEPFCRRVEELSARFDLPELTEAAEWAEARRANARRERGAMGRLWALRGLNKSTTCFELFALRFPRPLFRLAVRVIQKGKI